MSEYIYTMTMSLNVLNHLGIQLYSNIPAVLSEVVANSWDADAELVEIKIDIEKNIITITDDGHGMSVEDINKKYLYVGYERRKDTGSQTSKYKRAVMGRKGIGKLSLFSIAKTIEIHSIKEGKETEKNGLILSAEKIKEMIDVDNELRDYHPEVVHSESINLTNHGTKIILTDLKKGLKNTSVNVPYGEWEKIPRL